jgi:hypothetical protein
VRLQLDEDPNLIIGKLLANGLAAAESQRFAVVAAPIAARLEHSAAAFVRSLRRLPTAASRSYLPGQFAVMVIVEGHAVNDLRGLVVSLRRLASTPTAAADLDVQEAAQLADVDGVAVSTALKRLELPESVVTGRSPRCSTGG